MTKQFSATAILRTSVRDDGTDVEITFAARGGRGLTLRLPAALAHTLAEALADFASAQPATGPVMTKLPKTFAVGTGRYEPLVLVRFEDEAPYGLEADEAAELGRALIEQSEAVVSHAPMLLRQ